MGRGGYRGASTIVFPASRKWQSEEFYALPLDPHWMAKVQKEKQKADTRAGVKNELPEKHIFEGEVLRSAIIARDPALLEETKELKEARLYCPKNVGMLKLWLTQVASPFVPLPKGQFIKFSWKKAATLARQQGLRPFWPPRRRGLSVGDIEILKRVGSLAARALKASYPELIRVIYIDEDE
ncbi:MAG: hypothetical protein HDQ92_07065 [Desulfovibrio sp.]|nr:hypothetical protein [Desulfovibrio sp.]